jgi:hypothetical protein
MLDINKDYSSFIERVKRFEAAMTGIPDFDSDGRFPGINLILGCGNLPPEYLTFLVTRFNAPLFYVRGNHGIRPGGYRLEGCIDYD